MLELCQMKTIITYAVPLWVTNFYFTGEAFFAEAWSRGGKADLGQWRPTNRAARSASLFRNHTHAQMPHRSQ